MRCFFQADDAGLSAGVTDGIISCLDRGPLAGVGIIMGATHDAGAGALLAARKDIALSVHLNLLEGRAVAPSRLIRPLVGEDGRFCHSLGSLAAELFFSGRKKKRLLQAIETEFRAQIERFAAFAPERPLRLDSPLHVHVLPPLLLCCLPWFVNTGPVMCAFPRSFFIWRQRLPRSRLWGMRGALFWPAGPSPCIPFLLRKALRAAIFLSAPLPAAP